jgi:hypothetical protein
MIACDMRDEHVDMALGVNPAQVEETIESMDEIVDDYMAHRGVPPRARMVFQQARRGSWRSKGEAARREERRDLKLEVRRLQQQVGSLKEELAETKAKAGMDT